jgi:hypothetical protein
VTFQQPAAGFVNPALTGVAGTLAADVIDTVKHAARRAPRSVQVTVGPSELGTPCIRRLAYKLLAWPQANADTDPWTAVIGTATHAWMAEAFTEENRQLGQERYLIERRVHLPLGISGSCDLYDRATGQVVDWKISSPQNIGKYRKNGPGEQYRVQAHLYALGMQLAGEKPKDVAICFLPRGGRIDGLHVWSEPYNPLVAVDAIRRYEATQLALVAADPEKTPSRWELFPTGDAYCLFCPFHLPGSADLSQGCPGHNAAPKEK